jgi:hypothetical protein
MSKNQSIENSVYKNNARQEIADQIAKWAKSLCKKNIRILTLPGEQCLFEKMLVAKCKRYGIKVTGICCENKLPSFRKMRKNLPEGLSPSCYDIEYYDNESFDVIWLDYCGTPHYQDCIRIKSLQKIVKKNPVSLIYVTFMTNALRIKGGIAEMRKVLLDEFNLTDNPDNSESDIVKYAIHRHLVVGNKRVHNVMNIVYAGGESGVSDMQTLGYQCGLTKILPLNEQDWLTPVREANEAKYLSPEQVKDEDKVQALIDRHQTKALDIVDEIKTLQASIADDLKVLKNKLAKELEKEPILEYSSGHKDGRIAITKILRSEHGLTNGEIQDYFRGSVKIWSYGDTTERIVPTKTQICAVTNWMD